MVYNRSGMDNAGLTRESYGRHISQSGGSLLLSATLQQIAGRPTRILADQNRDYRSQRKRADGTTLVTAVTSVEALDGHPVGRIL